MSLLIEAIKKEVHTEQGSQRKCSYPDYSDAGQYSDEGAWSDHWNDGGHHTDSWSDGGPIVTPDPY